MRAIQLLGPDCFEVQEVEDPKALPGELVVAVAACGICGSDLHLLDGTLPIAAPMIPGHEFWGNVVAVGRDVKGFTVDDRVAVNPSINCGACRQCRKGRGNLCENRSIIGGDRPGGWAQFVSVPGSSAFHIPPSVSASEAVLIEPVACAVRAIDRLAVSGDDEVIVFGAGTMGLVLAILLQKEVAAVTLVEISELRRDWVRNTLPLDIVSPDELEGRLASIVVDASGHKSAIAALASHADVGAKILMFGVSGKDLKVDLSPYDVYSREWSIMGSNSIAGEFQRAIDMLSDSGELLGKCVTHSFSLDQIDLARATMVSGEGVKVSLTPSIV